MFSPFYFYYFSKNIMIEKEDKASKKRANKFALLTLYWVSWEHPTLA